MPALAQTHGQAEFDQLWGVAGTGVLARTEICQNMSILGPSQAFNVGVPGLNVLRFWPCVCVLGGRIGVPWIACPAPTPGGGGSAAP